MKNQSRVRTDLLQAFLCLLLCPVAFYGAGVIARDIRFLDRAAYEWGAQIGAASLCRVFSHVTLVLAMDVLGLGACLLALYGAITGLAALLRWIDGKE